MTKPLSITKPLSGTKLSSITMLTVLLSACNSSNNSPDNITTFSSLNLSGHQRVEQTVTADITLSNSNGGRNTQVFYQWFADNAKIESATDASMALGARLLNQSVHVVATLIDSRGYVDSIASEPFNVIPAFQLGLISDMEKVNSFSYSSDDGQTWSNFSEIATSHIDEYHYEPAVATDNKGNLVAVSISEYNPNFAMTNRTDYDIVFSYSHDSAVTWSEWALLNPDDTTGGQSGEWSSDYSPKILTNGNGVWMVAWESNHDIDSSGLDSDVFVTVSNDNGVSWTAPTLINNYGAIDANGDYSVDLAMLGERWFAVWKTNYSLDNVTNSDDDVVLAYSDDNGTTWSDPVYINDDATTDSTHDTRPQIAFNTNGHGLVAWSGVYDGIDNDIYIKRTTNGGLTWSARTAVNSTATSDTTDDWVTDLVVGDLVNGSSSPGIVTWVGETISTGTDAEPQMSYSMDAGITWSNALVLNEDANTNDGREYFVNVTAKPDTGWIFSWVDNDSGNTFMRATDDLVTWESMINLGIDTDENIALFYY